MKKSVFFIFFFPLILYAINNGDLSTRIIIDGHTSDYLSDESMLHPNGEILESDHDSFWGKENEVIDIKTTWDSNALYIALDGVLNGNNMMFFLDFKDGGIEDFNPQNTYNSISWKRSITFIKHYPDFYVGTWENNTNPIVYGASSSLGDYEITQSSGSVLSKAYLPTGIRGAIEIKISWDFIKSVNNNTIPKIIRMASCITNGGFGAASSPDVAPDNSSGTSSDGQSRVFIDNFVEINIDNDNDGKPDIGISPVSQRSFTQSFTLPHKPSNISIEEFSADKKIIKINGEQNKFELSLKVNIPALFDLEAYDIKGKKVKTIFYNRLLENDQTYSIEWNGKDDNDEFLQKGFYILQLVNSDRTVSKKISVGIIR